MSQELSLQSVEDPQEETKRLIEEITRLKIEIAYLKKIAPLITTENLLAEAHHKNDINAITYFLKKMDHSSSAENAAVRSDQLSPRLPEGSMEAEDDERRKTITELTIEKNYYADLCDLTRDNLLAKMVESGDAEAMRAFLPMMDAEQKKNALGIAAHHSQLPMMKMLWSNMQTELDTEQRKSVLILALESAIQSGQTNAVFFLLFRFWREEGHSSQKKIALTPLLTLAESMLTLRDQRALAREHIFLRLQEQVLVRSQSPMQEQVSVRFRSPRSRSGGALSEESHEIGEEKEETNVPTFPRAASEESFDSAMVRNRLFSSLHSRVSSAGSDSPVGPFPAHKSSARSASGQSAPGDSSPSRSFPPGFRFATDRYAFTRPLLPQKKHHGSIPQQSAAGKSKGPLQRFRKLLEKSKNELLEKSKNEKNEFTEDAGYTPYREIPLLDELPSHEGGESLRERGRDGRVKLPLKPPLHVRLSALLKRGSAEAVVRFLRSHPGIQPDEVVYKRDTPLMWAARYGHQEVIEILLESTNPDVNRANEDGETALCLATQNNHLEVMARLLLHKVERGGTRVRGIEIDQTDQAGRAALHHAAATLGCKNAVKMLLTCHANINLKDEDGCTPLMLAVMNRNRDNVRVLIRGGTDLEAKDNQDKTAKDYAEDDEGTKYLFRPEIIEKIRQSAEGHKQRQHQRQQSSPSISSASSNVSPSFWKGLKKKAQGAWQSRFHKRAVSAQSVGDDLRRRDIRAFVPLTDASESPSGLYARPEFSVSGEEKSGHDLGMLPPNALFDDISSPSSASHTASPSREAMDTGHSTTNVSPDSEVLTKSPSP